MNADISLLTAGFIIVFVFIILVLGKFNLVEHKVCILELYYYSSINFV